MANDTQETRNVAGRQSGSPFNSPTLTEMLSEITPENLQPNFSFGAPRGREVLRDDAYLMGPPDYE